MEITKDAAYTVSFFMADATDDETAETGLSPTVYLSKASGAFATSTNSATEIGRGWYYIALTTTETNTEGELIVEVEGTGADVWRSVYQVKEALPAEVTLVASEKNELADHIWRRKFSNVEASVFGDTIIQESPIGALLKLAGYTFVDTVPTPDQLVVHKSDGTTEFYRQDISTDPNADPIVSVGA